MQYVTKTVQSVRAWFECVQLTNSLELSTAWEATTCAATW
jgi:hypothetical protein